PTRLSASCAPAAPALPARANASAAARAGPASRVPLIGTAGPQEKARREAAAAEVGAQPAAERVLQLESGSEIGAARLLGVAAQLEWELQVQEQAGTEIASGGQREPTGRLLPDLEHVEPEPLAGGVRDRVREGAHRHLLPGPPRAVPALALEQRIVRGRASGHDVGEDVVLAHRGVGREVEAEAVEPALRVHVDQHALVVATALGRYLVGGVDVELGGIDRSHQVDVPVRQPELA